MNNFKYPIYLLILFFFLSCDSSYVADKTIHLASLIAEENPDSAYRLLESVPQPGHLPAAHYAAWCFYYTYTQYKLDYPIQSDSIIEIAIAYYEARKETEKTGVAYYLKAYVNEMAGNRGKAIELYKKAVNYLSTIENKRWKALANFRIGYMYREENLYEQALDYFKRALEFFFPLNDTFDLACTYSMIANMYYYLLYPADTVLHYSDIALEMSKQLPDSTLYYETLALQGTLLYNTNSSKSKQYLLAVYNFNPGKYYYASSFLAYLYSWEDKIDSTQYFLNLVPESERQQSFSALANAYVAAHKKDYHRAYKYMQQAYRANDSTNMQWLEAQLFRIEKQYDLNQKENENALLKLRNKNNAIIILVLILILLTIIVISLLIINKHRKKKTTALLDKQQVEHKLQQERLQNNLKKELLAVNLKNKTDNIIYMNNLKNGFSKREKQTAFIEKLQTQLEISKEEWKLYVQDVDKLFNGRLKYISQEYSRLTNTDMIVIALISLGYDILDCADLLKISTNSMYTRRNRIKRHIDLSQELSLENWIDEHIVHPLNESQ